jgi:signal peptidase II
MQESADTRSVEAGNAHSTPRKDAPITVTTMLGTWKFAKTILRSSANTQEGGWWGAFVVDAIRYAIFIFVLDQVSKQIFRDFPTDVIDPSVARYFNIVQHHNTGAIANIPVPLPLLIGISIAILFFIIHAFRDAVSRNNRHAAYALACVFGGALSNLYNRVSVGYVFDWILLFGQSAINIADIAIVLGVVWYLVAMRNTQSISATPAA